MAPRFKILAGPSFKELEPIAVNVNPSKSTSLPAKFPFEIKTDEFEGRVVGNVLGYTDEDSRSPVDSEYFAREDRRDITWSVHIQGRFLVPIQANDVLFGNVFLQDLNLPWGSGALLQFASLVDPTLDHDLTCPNPWALSPLISTMPHMSHTQVSPSAPLPPPSLTKSVVDNGMVDLLSKGSQPGGIPPLRDATARRAWFGNEEHRKNIEFWPDDVLEMDFCYGYLQFPSLDISIPGGWSFELKKYWNGQPVHFVVCERNKETGRGPGKIFFCVAFEVIDEEEEDEEEDEDEEEKVAPKESKPDERNLADDID